MHNWFPILFGILVSYGLYIFFFRLVPRFLSDPPVPLSRQTKPMDIADLPDGPVFLIVEKSADVYCVHYTEYGDSYMEYVQIPRANWEVGDKFSTGWKGRQVRAKLLSTTQQG